MLLCPLSCTETVSSDMCLSHRGFGREGTCSLPLTPNNPNPLRLQAVRGCFQCHKQAKGLLLYTHQVTHRKDYVQSRPLKLLFLSPAAT